MTQITTSGFSGFSTSFTRFDDTTGTTWLRATSQYIDTVNNNCIGRYVTETCDFRVGVNIYPLLYQNYTAVLNPYINETLVQESPTSDDSPTAAFESPAGLLSGLNWFADTYLVSNSTIVHGKDPSGNELYIEIPSGWLATSFLNLTDAFEPGVLGCQFEWSSPTDYILRSLNMVAFNAAMLAGLASQSSSDLQSFPALQTQTKIVYVSDFGYLGAAMFVHSIAIFIVSITLWGFWQIGHETTLSPLQTGRAFGSPILAPGEGPGTGETLKKLVTEVGKKQVKYGVVAMDGGNGIRAEKLTITHPQFLVRHFK